MRPILTRDLRSISSVLCGGDLLVTHKRVPLYGNGSHSGQYGRSVTVGMSIKTSLCHFQVKNDFLEMLVRVGVSPGYYPEKRGGRKRGGGLEAHEGGGPSDLPDATKGW